MKSFILLALIISSSASASDTINVSCVIAKAGVTTKCEKTIPASSLTKDELSLRALDPVCADAAPYDLKLKLSENSGFYAANVDVRITKTKKRFFGGYKEKTLNQEGFMVGPGISATMSLTYFVNGNGIGCELKTQ